MNEKTCEFCRFAGLAEGLDAGRLVCAHLEAVTKVYKIVGCAETCDDWGLHDNGTFDPGDVARAGTRLIPVKGGPFAIVDAADYEALSKYQWYAVYSSDTSYAVTRHQGRTLYMHRLITDAPKGMDVDHIDRNGLNNANKNLRLCTHAENMRNNRPASGGSSKYKGVSWDVRGRKFRARIAREGKHHNLGLFTDEKEAALAYDKQARVLFGEFAYLNFPDEHAEPDESPTSRDRLRLRCAQRNRHQPQSSQRKEEKNYVNLVALCVLCVHLRTTPFASFAPFRGRGPPTNPDKLLTGARPARRDGGGGRETVNIMIRKRK